MNQLTPTIFAGKLLQEKEAITIVDLQNYMCKQDFERIPLPELQVILDTLYLGDFLEKFSLDGKEYFNIKNKTIVVQNITRTITEPLNLQTKLYATDLGCS